ncbi:patatin-like phospholipase domain-containing protein 2 [Lineus longissimus]|uniref:patatin-like phospholipase domain-containing protein 2 n=1 Tax=Lineus longissimus TaxID=88925 RepID=UPI002B4F95B0
MNLSFAGCGFLGIYHVGVASCIREYAPHLSKGKISGASAGALAAACLLTDVCLGECTTFVLHIATKARSRALGPFHPSFNIAQILQDGIESILPPDAHKMCSGRLHISLTRVSDRKNLVVSEYESRQDLIQALMCSAFIPFYSGLIPPTYRGARYVDGGLSDNIPILNDNTITVSPWAGESDICPRDMSASFLYFNLANTSIQCSTRNLYRMTRILFPPHPEILSQMCRQGFDDALNFLQRNNLISCVNHLSITSSIHQEGRLVSECESETDQVDSSLELDGACAMESDDAHEVEEMVDGTIERDVCYADDDCHECRRRQQVALLDSPPDIVMNKLHDACVRNSLMANVYNHRVYRILALMMSPSVLPFDILVNVTKRFYSYLPHMTTDAKWVIGELPHAVRVLLKYLTSKRKSYSARFTCELNITEMEFNQELERDKAAGVLVNRSKVRNVNLGFAMDLKTEAKSPLECLHQLEQQVMEEHRAGHDVNITATVEDVDSSPSVDSQGHATRSKRATHCAQGYDAFETYLERVEEMDTVMSFYYLDENNTMKMTEICAVKPSLSSCSSRAASLTSLNQLPKPVNVVSPLVDRPNIDADMDDVNRLKNGRDNFDGHSYERDQLEANSFCRVDNFEVDDDRASALTSSLDLQWDDEKEIDDNHFGEDFMDFDYEELTQTPASESLFGVPGC